MLASPQSLYVCFCYTFSKRDALMLMPVPDLLKASPWKVANVSGNHSKIQAHIAELWVQMAYASIWNLTFSATWNRVGSISCSSYRPSEKKILDFCSCWWADQCSPSVITYCSIGCVFIHVLVCQTRETLMLYLRLSQTPQCILFNNHILSMQPPPPLHQKPCRRSLSLSVVSSECGRGPLLCYIHSVGDPDSLVTQHQLIRTQRRCCLDQRSLAKKQEKTQMHCISEWKMLLTPCHT